MPQAEEDLLDDLLGRGHLPQDPSGQGVDGAGVASVGLGEGILAPSSDGDDERGVAGLVQVVGLRSPSSIPRPDADDGGGAGPKWSRTDIEGRNDRADERSGRCDASQAWPRWPRLSSGWLRGWAPAEAAAAARTARPAARPARAAASTARQA